MQQAALPIEDHSLAAGSESRIQRQHVLLPQWGGQEQFAQVFGENPDGLGVGLLLSLHAKLRLDGESEQTLVAVGDGQSHLFAGGRGALLQEEAFEKIERVLLRRGHAQEKKPLLLAAAHGQQPVTRHGGHGLGPVEVVLVLCPLGFLVGNDAGAQHAGRPVEIPKARAGLGVVAEPLGENIASPGQGGGHVGQLLRRIHEGGRHVQGIQRRLLGEDAIRQRLQPRLLGNHRPGAALRTVRREQILKGGKRVGRAKGHLQRLGEEVSLGQRFHDRLAPLLHFDHLRHAIADGGHGHLVESTSGLLAVPGNERNGRPFGEQSGGGGHHRGRRLQLGGDARNKSFVHAGGAL